MSLERGAVISPCGKYRYRLWRRWSTGPEPITFIMLNPSTADAEEVDHMKLTGGKGSGFITEQLPKPGQPRLVKGRDMVG